MMKISKEELEKIRISAILCGEIDKYVYLRKDEKGFYIEYAFQDGVPHDNRCLSWYDSYQEKAYIRNGWTKSLSEEEAKEFLSTIKNARERKVGELFKLSSFTCGYEEDLENCLKDSEERWKEYHPGVPFVAEDHICKVGCPAKRCREELCTHWTYEEPVKCACWYLKEAKPPVWITIPIDLAVELYKEGRL